MEQEIDLELWADFEKEVNKIGSFDVSKLELSKEDNQVLDVFFKKFLNPQEDFPAGERHTTIEKNFAIYIVKNNIPLEEIKEAYKSKGFDINSLRSQIKGVLNGTYGTSPHVSIGELVNWCKKYRADLISLFIDFSEPDYHNERINHFNLLWDNQLKDYEEKNANWLVDRFLKPKSIVVLAGKRSTLKSWLAMNLGYSLATGNNFLEIYPCVKGKVLYLDRENGFSELKKRSLMEKKGLGIEEAEMGFLSETTIKLDNYPDIQQIKEFILVNDIKLLIVDTYRRVISFKEDNADEVSQFFVDILKPLCEQTGVSIILIHHERKGESQGDDMDMLRGSSDLANYVDAIIQIERKGDFLTIKQTKQRGSKELEPFQVKVETDELTFFKFQHKGEKESTEVVIAKYIISWILETDKKNFTYTEALNYCEQNGYKKSNIVNALRDLQNKGILRKETPKSPYVVTNQINQKELV